MLKQQLGPRILVPTECSTCTKEQLHVLLAFQKQGVTRPTWQSPKKQTHVFRNFQREPNTSTISFKPIQPFLKTRPFCPHIPPPQKKKRPRSLLGPPGSSPQRTWRRTRAAPSCCPGPVLRVTLFVRVGPVFGRCSREATRRNTRKTAFLCGVQGKQHGISKSMLGRPTLKKTIPPGSGRFANSPA